MEDHPLMVKGLYFEMKKRDFLRSHKGLMHPWSPQVGELLHLTSPCLVVMLVVVLVAVLVPE